VYFLDTNVKESGDGVVHVGHDRLFRKFKTTEGKHTQNNRIFFPHKGS